MRMDVPGVGKIGNFMIAIAGCNNQLTMKAINTKLVFAFLFCFCLPAWVKAQDCHESRSFKRKYFKAISTIETYTRDTSKVVSFRADMRRKKKVKRALDFMAKYPGIDRRITRQCYGFGYFNIAMFESDKEKWLKWYEQNKCKKHLRRLPKHRTRVVD